MDLEGLYANPTCLLEGHAGGIRMLCVQMELRAKKITNSTVAPVDKCHGVPCVEENCPESCCKRMRGVCTGKLDL